MGEPTLVDLDEESDSEDQDFDSWEPDPVDADPSKTVTALASLLINNIVPTNISAKTSRSRQTSDIIR